MEKLERIEEKTDKIEEKAAEFAAISTMTNRVLFTVKLASTTHRDPEFRQNVYSYQKQFVQRGQCIILSQKFPKSVSIWRKKGGTAARLKTVADHLLPHCRPDLCQEFGFDRNNERNGLPLLAHIEKQYGQGNISLMPVESGPEVMKLEISVGHAILDDYLFSNIETKDYLEVVRAEEIQDGRENRSRVKFKDLQGFQFNVKRVFLRSLFVRAYAVHAENKSLPDPCAKLRSFESCTSFQEKMQAFYSRQVADPDTEVIEECW